MSKGKVNKDYPISVEFGSSTEELIYRCAVYVHHVTGLRYVLDLCSTNIQGGGGGGGGGHSHTRRVYSCDRGQDVVKRSRHFFGGGQTVK